MPGRRFKTKRQPWSGLLLDAIGSGKWRRIACVGPTQSGKTLVAFIICVLYHLFERREDVIVGLPDMNMSNRKWTKDFLPVIKRMRYKALLPTRGEGSRGGKVKSCVEFTNGVSLLFMTGGGGDKQRAGATGRVVAITEVDGMDEAGAASDEADKITQLEVRASSFGKQAQTYMECTVSHERGRIWREYDGGTQSRIALPCPHCGEYVTPEREHLVGWQDAESVIQADELTHFICPECEHPWTDAERIEANERGVLLHGDQTIDRDGNIEGDEPETDTLGFRWSAVNNVLFWESGYIGMREWRAQRNPDEEEADREMSQFVWAVPPKSRETDLTSLEFDAITRRVLNFERGIVPGNTIALTAGVDVGSRWLHWLIMAWRGGAAGHVVEYGELHVPSDQHGIQHGIFLALRALRDTLILPGFPDRDGVMCVPDLVIVDAGYQGEANEFPVYEFVNETASGDRFIASKGRGIGQYHSRPYTKPTQRTQRVKFIGERYHAARLEYQPRQFINLLEIDVDHWKTWMHDRLRTPVDSSGAMTLYQARPSDHLQLARHWTAERQVEEFVAGKGDVVRWEPVRRANHLFDAAVLACVAGHRQGVRLLQSGSEDKGPKTTSEWFANQRKRRPVR